MNEKQKAELAKSIVDFMAKRGVDVAVVDSLLDPGTLAVFLTDGGKLARDDGLALAHYVRGWKLFGQFIR